MGLPRTKQLLKLLEENPEGLNIYDLEERLGCKRRSVFDALKVLKKTSKIDKDRRMRYILKAPDEIDTPTPTPEPPKPSSKWGMTKLDKIAEAIYNSPNGLTKVELSKMFNIKSGNISNRIFNLRRKGHNIQCIMGRYQMLSAPALVAKSASLPKEKPAEKNPAIPAEYQEAYRMLSDSDKVDFADMLRKSIYYRKSAIALLESNIEIESLLSSIEACYA